MNPPLSTLSSGVKLLPIISLLVLAPLVGAPPPPPVHRVLPGTIGGSASSTTDTITASDGVGPFLDAINTATSTEESALYAMRRTTVQDVNNAQSAVDASISGQESYLSGHTRLLSQSGATSCNTTTANNASSGVLPVMGIEVGSFAWLIDISMLCPVPPSSSLW